MSRKHSVTFAALLAGICLVTLLSAPASAQAWRGGAAQFAQGDSLAAQVQYRYRGYNRGYRRGFDPGAAVALGIISLATGIIANSQLAPAPYVVGGPDWIDYCASRYRSFDPRSGTYLGYDGYRHYCN